ncbi:nuclear transport factor 2 family protein [Aureibacillus halotolerans]|uniref:DUF6841 domain-containing protein n=1 Tax=Aureibacillus halotolerans TaxID=1508390 RepID=A0A4R6U3Y6_9BACI|nr:nuclear transport factor 2 family protein [Aureibacillus halotolerans]TDQ39145.1 hypothetical protein EV213_10892 [Aureibacillus halotolerans]
MSNDVLKKKAEDFFQTYETKFNEALNDTPDLEVIVRFYSEEFISVNPLVVKTGINNESLKDAMAEAYEYYRSIGTKHMECLDVSITVLDDKHFVAHTKWNSVYEKNGEEISIPFQSNYLLQENDTTFKIFGWITGDEQSLLKENGII